MIEMYRVYKSYAKGINTLTNVSFKMEKGEIVFIIGPSGAGKTTLLRLVFCDETPDTGQLIVNGKNLLKINSYEKARLRRTMGVVLQDFNLLPNRTVYENIAFVQRVIGIPEQDIKKRVASVLKLTGLYEKRDSAVSKLSGGEHQIAAIARAMVNDPMIIIADEPTANLDDDMADYIIELLRNINKRRGTTIVIATHGSRLINSSDRILSLKAGKLEDISLRNSTHSMRGVNINTASNSSIGMVI